MLYLSLDKERFLMRNFALIVIIFSAFLCSPVQVMPSSNYFTFSLFGAIRRQRDLGSDALKRDPLA